MANKMHVFGEYDYEGEHFYGSFATYEELIADENYLYKGDTLNIYIVNEDGDLVLKGWIESKELFAESVEDGKPNLMLPEDF